MQAKLLKQMVVDGKTMPAGSVLDVSKWRNAKSLESSRYIAFLLEDQPKEPKPKVAQKVAQDISFS